MRCTYFLKENVKFVKKYARKKLLNSPTGVIEEITVGAIIAATGHDVFDGSKMVNYGYGKYPDVISALEFERMVNSSGFSQGHQKRASRTREYPPENPSSLIGCNGAIPPCRSSAYGSQFSSLCGTSPAQGLGCRAPGTLHFDLDRPCRLSAGSLPVRRVKTSRGEVLLIEYVGFPMVTDGTDGLDRRSAIGPRLGPVGPARRA